MGYIVSSQKLEKLIERSKGEETVTTVTLKKYK